MSRGEFLQELRVALQGKIPQVKVNEHLRYYENYIIEESRKGKTEAEVMDELGNPRLIAKTLVETEDISDYQYVSANEKAEKDRTSRNIRLRSWYKLIPPALILLLLLVIFLWMASLLFPIVCIVFIIIIMYRLLFSGK